LHSCLHHFLQNRLSVLVKAPLDHGVQFRLEEFQCKAGDRGITLVNIQGAEKCFESAGQTPGALAARTQFLASPQIKIPAQIDVLGETGQRLGSHQG